MAYIIDNKSPVSVIYCTKLECKERERLLGNWKKYGKDNDTRVSIKSSPLKKKQGH